MERIFYVLYIEDRLAGPCLDLIRFVCDPRGSTRSHVTLRGPYRNYARAIRNWASYNPGSIRITGLGNFFETGQSTVFLHCEIPAIGDVWYKPDYPKGIPHVTLYDGGSMAFARQLFARLEPFTWRLQVAVGPLEPLVARHQRGLPIWSHEVSMLYWKITGRELEWHELRVMDDEARLELASDVARCLHGKEVRSVAG
jgi:hypothetical protein